MCSAPPTAPGREDTADWSVVYQKCWLQRGELKVCTGISGGGAAWFFEVHSTKALQSEFFSRHWHLKEQRRLFLYREEKHYIKGWDGCTFTFTHRLSKAFQTSQSWPDWSRSPDVNTPLRSVPVRFVILVCVCVCPAQGKEWQKDNEASLCSFFVFVFFCLFFCIIPSVKRTNLNRSVRLQATITFSSALPVAACPTSGFLLAHKKTLLSPHFLISLLHEAVFQVYSAYLQQKGVL